MSDLKPSNIHLGDRVKDLYTGFTGRATGRSEYIGGTTRILVEAESVKNAEPVSQWIDEPRLTFAPNGKPAPKLKPAKTSKK